MSSGASLLMVYDYFYPAYRAGGPIQSLTNITRSLLTRFDVHVFCGNKELNERTQLTGIETGKWFKTDLPGADKSIQVWYTAEGASPRKQYLSCLQTANPGTVYLNGMFSWKFVIIPLLYTDRVKHSIVLCPRGMLQEGALAGKAFKKRLFLTLLKMSKLVKNITWHATNEAEEADIKRVFGNKAKILVAPNIPRKPVSLPKSSAKKQSVLKLVYLSLIAEKKNLLQLIELISRSGAGITLDIYGPPKDIAYWEKCKEAIQHSDGRIFYKGDVLPETTQELFSRYDAAILLTKGENFGHAIYECLGAGRPVITSHFTPWLNLENDKAGWNVDISDEAAILGLLDRIQNMDTAEHQIFCEGAYRLAAAYYSANDFTAKYTDLFTLTKSN